MEDAFIGRRAVELRIRRLESELKQTEVMIQQLAPVLHVLSRQNETLFTRYFVQSTVREKLKDYLRGLEITTEASKIDEQLSQLDLLWLNEQRRTIERLGQEIKELRSQKDQKAVSLGQLKEQIRQLEYERLPEQYRISLYLFYYEEYSAREIAQVMGKSEANITQYLSRGRRKLRALLTEERSQVV